MIPIIIKATADHKKNVIQIYKLSLKELAILFSAAGIFLFKSVSNQYHTVYLSCLMFCLHSATKLSVTFSFDLDLTLT